MTGPDTAASDRVGRGRASAATAVCFWSVGNVIVAGFDLPGLQIGFWRLLLGAVVYGTFFYAGGRRITWATVRLVALPAVARTRRWPTPRPSEHSNPSSSWPWPPAATGSG
jgi:hypothetical protein